MRRRTCLALLAVGLAAALPALSHAAEPQAGRDFGELRSPQPVDAGNKVEVIEFFAYYCPHCHAFEPQLEAWVKKQGDNIVFRRVHVENGAAVLPQERLFYTLEAMGLLDRYHAKVFEAMHVQNLRLRSDEEVFDWVAQNGIDRAKFVEAYGSFGIRAKLSRVAAKMNAYEVDHWPMVVVDGRWVTSPSRAAGLAPNGNEAQKQQAALQVMDTLVERARAAKARP